MGQSESKRMSDYRRHILMDEEERERSRVSFSRIIESINPLRLFWSLLNVMWRSYLFQRLSTRSKESELELFWDHPLLAYRPTIRWIRRESPNILILLRGLPGSGKSTLGSFIKQKYPYAEIASADYFFIDPQTGEYKFRIEDLPEAHNQCQKFVLSAMFEERNPMIIIDNTSISKWEMEPYFALASSADYSVLVIHPKTPWAWDVDELAKRNTHDVPLETLTKKLNKALKKPIPLYYAWFLSNVASRDVMSCSYWLLKHCLENCLDFQKEFLGYLPPNASINQKKLLNSLISFYRPSEDILHVTSKFIGFDINAASKYSDRVEEHMGEVHQLTLYGYTFSRYAFGARVRLNSESSIDLYDADESFLPKQETYRINRATRRLHEHIECPNLCPSFPEYMRGDTIYPESSKEFFHPNPGKGKRCHITLGTRHGSQPVNTGYDALRTAHQEEETENGMFKTWVVPDIGILRKIDFDLWTLYLFRTVDIHAMFCGYYK